MLRAGTRDLGFGGADWVTELVSGSVQWGSSLLALSACAVGQSFATTPFHHMAITNRDMDDAAVPALLL
jgi:hypothetical protein